jgi:hypothetical protein
MRLLFYINLLSKFFLSRFNYQYFILFIKIFKEILYFYIKKYIIMFYICLFTILNNAIFLLLIFQLFYIDRIIFLYLKESQKFCHCI